MTAPSEQCGRMRLAQHVAVSQRAQVLKLAPLGICQLSVGVAVEQFLVALQVQFRPRTPNDSPQRIVVQPVKRCQIGL